MTDPRIKNAREALIAGCVTLSCLTTRHDAVRGVFEDILPMLQGHLSGADAALLDRAEAWLSAPDFQRRHAEIEAIKYMTREMFLDRALRAHDRIMAPTED